MMKMQRGCLVAIHPIDLQTLYSQMDKVGRQQGAEQQAASSVKDMQQHQNKLDAQKRLSTVQTVAQGDSENIRINKDSDSKYEDRSQEKKGTRTETEQDMGDKEENYIKDPYLGQKVDISG